MVTASSAAKSLASKARIYKMNTGDALSMTNINFLLYVVMIINTIFFLVFKKIKAEVACTMFFILTVILCTLLKLPDVKGFQEIVAGGLSKAEITITLMVYAARFVGGAFFFLYLTKDILLCVAARKNFIRRSRGNS